MGKRKPEEDQDESMEEETLDVDFDYFDLQEGDFHSLCSLVKQLLSHDAKDLDISGLSDFMIQQGTGSAVKCDGASSDAYAFCSVVNAAESSNTAAQQLAKYLLERTQSKASQAASLLQQAIDQKKADLLGILLNERLINMPPQITAPFLRLLEAELAEGLKQGRPLPQHLLFLSRVFVPDAGDEEAPPTSKKKKKATAAAQKEDTGLFVYHAEDEVIAKAAPQFAEEVVDFDFANAPEREQDSFGVDTRGRLMLVKTDRLDDLINQLEVEGEQ